MDQEINQYEYVACGVVVKELENCTIGPSSACDPAFQRAHPWLYWNLVVHFLLLDCPLDFLHLP